MERRETAGGRAGMARAVNGRVPLVLSICSRFGVVVLLCCLALWTEYLNLKIGYNNARLVELSSGVTMRLFYEFSDALFGFFGEPVAAAQANAGMTWSIRLFGVPFTDPLALLSLALQGRVAEVGFVLGAIIPLALALICGRVFCSYICPASLLFFSIGRLRRRLGDFFYFPEVGANRGLAWGVLCGGLALSLAAGHGVWILILPYFAMGQTIFHSIAFGTLSVALFSLIAFALLDLFLGYQFTCRNVCPTGRLLGRIGSRALVTVRRDASECLDACTACVDVCPFRVNPKLDETRDCSLCGECAVICPTQCLTLGRRKK